MFKASRAPRRGAFTLVELLVVIAIIALLISILLPALKRAKESGNAVKCMAHEKQIMTAMMMYASDNKNQMPLPPLIGEGFPGGSNDQKSLMYYMSAQSGGTGVIRYDAGSFWRYLGRANQAPPTAATEKASADGVFYRIFNCPSDTDFRAVRVGSINTNASWVRNFSYSWNIQIRQQPTASDPVVRKLNQINQPGNKILLIEEWMPNDGMAYIMVSNPDDVPVFRHNGNGNYGFADGHIAALSPKELGFSQPTKSMANSISVIDMNKSRSFFLLNKAK